MTTAQLIGTVTIYPFSAVDWNRDDLSLCQSTLKLTFIGGYLEWHSLEATTHWGIHSRLPSLGTIIGATIIGATTLLRQRLALNMSLHHCPATTWLDPRFYAHRPLSLHALFTGPCPFRSWLYLVWHPLASTTTDLLVCRCLYVVVVASPLLLQQGWGFYSKGSLPHPCFYSQVAYSLVASPLLLLANPTLFERHIPHTPTSVVDISHTPTSIIALWYASTQPNTHAYTTTIHHTHTLCVFCSLSLFHAISLSLSLSLALSLSFSLSHTHSLSLSLEIHTRNIHWVLRAHSGAKNV